MPIEQNFNQKNFYHDVGTVVLGFKSKLIFPKGKIKQEQYREYLNDSSMFDDVDQIDGKFQYIFQQDEATCHTTPKSYKFIEKRAMVLYGWPQNSPDLLPIEMFLSILKSRLCDVEPQSICANVLGFFFL